MRCEAEGLDSRALSPEADLVSAEGLSNFGRVSLAGLSIAGRDSETGFSCLTD